MGVKSGSSLFTATYFFGVTIYFKIFWKPWLWLKIKKFYQHKLHYVDCKLKIQGFFQAPLKKNFFFKEFQAWNNKFQNSKISR